MKSIHGDTTTLPPEVTYSTEGPICPYCARQYIADEGHYFDEQNYTEQECDGCEKTFKVRVYTSTSWTCEAIEATGATGATR